MKAEIKCIVCAAKISATKEQELLKRAEKQKWNKLDDKWHCPVCCRLIERSKRRN